VSQMDSTSPAAAASVHASVYDTIVSSLHEQKWIFHEEPAQHRVLIDYASAAGAWSTYAVAFEKSRQIAVYGVLPFAVEADQRAAVVELITRLNFGLIVGNFEIDVDDGEVRYKTSLDFEDGELTTPLLRQLVRANIAMMEHHLQAFVAVAVGKVAVAAALAEVEVEAAAS
jgi:hypothetical protein